jgi:surface protein
MFYDAEDFNADISGWDVSEVTDMTSMFAYAKDFNQDVSDWSVSVSATTTNMFQGATAFNDDREITATIATTQSVFTDAEIDLEISVKAGACGSSESSECNLLTTTNGRL